MSPELDRPMASGEMNFSSKAKFRCSKDEIQIPNLRKKGFLRKILRSMYRDLPTRIITKGEL